MIIDFILGKKQCCEAGWRRDILVGAGEGVKVQLQAKKNPEPVKNGPAPQHGF